MKTPADILSEARDLRQHAEATAPMTTRLQALLESVVFHASRAQDRARHDASLAEEHLKMARAAWNTVKEEDAPDLTEGEANVAWSIAMDIAADESVKDRARATMAEWGKLGAREAIRDAAEDVD